MGVIERRVLMGVIEGRGKVERVMYVVIRISL